MVAGMTRREEAEWERTAWLAATIINVAGKTVKNDVTVDQLLGRKKSFSNPQADFKALVARQQAINEKDSN